MTDLTLVESPRASYLDALLQVLRDAERFWMVTAFASSAGIDQLAAAIKAVLDRPAGQGNLIIAVDRRGFNSPKVFETLLALKAASKSKLALGVVTETTGLLHAKALLAKRPSGFDLLVGSANLTHSAFAANHELGVLAQGVDSTVQNAFHRFMRDLAPVSLDDRNAKSFLQARGLAAEESSASPPRPRLPNPSFAAVLEALRGASALELDAGAAEDNLGQWIDRGYLVGKGRSATDALIIRLPLDKLEARGLLQPTQRRRLGAAARESKTLGYSIDLLPAPEADAVRKEARRVSMLLAKLSLKLPCFGLWMPASYWEVFIGARDQLTQTGMLVPATIRALAERQRLHLDSGGIEIAIEQVLETLTNNGAVDARNSDKVRETLILAVRESLPSRSPALLADAIQFRTARQRWTPFERTDVPYRQLMVDIIQASFSTTYRTGEWPMRIASIPARVVVHAIAERLALASPPMRPDGQIAASILQEADTWETDMPFAEVVSEFRRFVPEDIEFPTPELARVLAEAASDANEPTVE